jgi:DNA topoisomerase-3
LSQTDEGKWRVEFDEVWAREGAKPPDAEAQAASADGIAAGGEPAKVGERSAA